MAVIHEFKYTATPGGSAISLHSWIQTLPTDQQTEFYSAEVRQVDFRSQVIEQGNLTLGSHNTYIWKDDAAAQQNKIDDPTWLRYFNRYLKENNITFEIITRQI